MSCFMVSDHHIDVMLTSGLTDMDPIYRPLRWQEPDHHVPEAASLVDIAARGLPWGSEAVALAKMLDRRLTPETANEIGAILLAANNASVNFRYDEDELEPVYLFQQAPASPVEVLKAIQCFEYQACETPEWDWSEARAICQALRMDAISQLAGYDDAPWSY